jgi:hypothetical protein
VVSILVSIWEAAGCLWSVRLKALIPLWLPWVRKHYALTPRLEEQLLKISPRQIDRRLREEKKRAGRRLYGRTKPGRCSSITSRSRRTGGMWGGRAMGRLTW